LSSTKESQKKMEKERSGRVERVVDKTLRRKEKDRGRKRKSKGRLRCCPGGGTREKEKKGSGYRIQYGPTFHDLGRGGGKKNAKPVRLLKKEEPFDGVLVRSSLKGKKGGEKKGRSLRWAAKEKGGGKKEGKRRKRGNPRSPCIFFVSLRKRGKRWTPTEKGEGKGSRIVC